MFTINNATSGLKFVKNLSNDEIKDFTILESTEIVLINRLEEIIHQIIGIAIDKDDPNGKIEIWDNTLEMKFYDFPLKTDVIREIGEFLGLKYYFNHECLDLFECVNHIFTNDKNEALEYGKTEVFEVNTGETLLLNEGV